LPALELEDALYRVLVEPQQGWQVRRCGKSTLFELFQDYLSKNNVDKSQIININFEDVDFEELTDYKKLHEYINSKLIKDKMNYIFLDEIQNVPSFQN
jgi:predicted AAA+ superfamily ATPase